MSDCIDPKVSTHGVEWQSEQCVDGGVLRAVRTYTNLEASGFNTDIGYSGHYYGIRKYTGLIPQAPYFIDIEGKTGDGSPVELPREIYEWEYGSNNRTAYSGIKIINPSGISNQFFGKSIAVKNDYMAVGMPFNEFLDSEGHQLEKPGTVYIYKRQPQPSGSDWTDQYDKGGWTIDSSIRLPSGILRDYVYQEIETKRLPNLGTDLPFSVKRRIWKVGQNGRQLGHSLDLCSTDNLEKSLGENEKNLLVVSGPSCKFDRTFEELTPSGVGVGLFIFTDNFEPSVMLGPNFTIYDYNYVSNNISDIDLLFRYFADPPTKFDIKIHILECLVDGEKRITKDFPEPKPSFVKKSNSVRHQGISRKRNPIAFQEKDDEILDSLKRAFFESFPYDETKINNNIPAILGFYIDNTASFGGNKAVQPALDRFIKFYEEYSFASGLKFIDQSPATGYTKKILGSNDTWAQEATSILKETLELSNLQQNNTYKLFADDIGDINAEATELNQIPYSGGCVYIFEKESGSWNIIQHIESPTRLSDVPPDRFGHAVKISENGEIIVIGSPYLGADNLIAYEYDENEKARLYNSIESWLSHRVSNETVSSHYSDLYNTLNSYKLTHSLADAYQKLYINLSPTDKFRLRNDYDYWGDNPIKEYKETFKYSNDLRGGWDFLINKFAPCPRLGYSVAVNEDGSVIAVGAPTDSFNEFNDHESYFAPNRPEYTTWPAYLHAGSVRVFESRKYYPHNTVVDYGKFGNLEYENAPSGEHKYFNHLENIYESLGLNFVKTEFTDPKIPEEAGLLFIIAPQVDALSNEVVNNIKNWLALGDRHLILVGNDPLWEKNGLYFDSNEIINKLLRRLDSGLVIQPARNEYESLTYFEVDKPNITPSFKPASTLFPVANVPVSLFGSGVGDIKPYFPNLSRSYDCSPKKDPLSLSSIFDMDLTYRSANEKCEIPINHLGDMRSQWSEWCFNERGQPLTYPVNWPIVFGSVKPSVYGCKFGDYSESSGPLPDYNFTPLLAAAEYPEPFIQIIPEVPVQSGYLPVGQVAVGTRMQKVLGVSESGVAFVWSSDSGNFTSLNYNINSIISDSRFFDPDEYNNKNGILQSIASKDINFIKSSKVVSEQSHFLAEENFPNSTSKIVLMAGTHTETESVLNVSSNYFLNFYFNLLAKNADGDSIIGQVSDWTGRSNFTDLNPDSVIKDYIEKIYCSIDTDISTQKLFLGTSDGFSYDIGWLVEPLSLPNEEQLANIKNWLNIGNKKLIITYQNTDAETLNRITKLCEMLNISMRPLFLTEKNKYASRIDMAGYFQSIYLNLNNKISSGFDGYDTFITSIPEPRNFNPIQLNNAVSLAYAPVPTLDDNIIEQGLWKIDSGITKVDFPVLPESGYKLFVSFTSENFTENQPLYFNIPGAVSGPLEPTLFDGTIEEKSFTFINGTGINNISLNIYTNRDQPSEPVIIRNTNYSYSPKTTRLISISGCLVPLVDEVAAIIYEPIYDWVITNNGSPETSITVVPPFREISTDNSKYCPSEVCVEDLGNKLIADGPIVAAQELEKFSGFEYGVNRSRITVLSDTSLIQGKSIVDENDSIKNNVINFLTGLYPFTRFPSETRGRSFSDYVTKIHPPERSTPSILFNSAGNVGHNLRFQTPTTPASGRPLTQFVESFDRSTFKVHFNVELGTGSQYLKEADPRKKQDVIIIEKSGWLTSYPGYLSSWGCYSKFAGEIEGKYYEDSGPNGGVPEIMIDTGYDYLDFDRFPSGYPGDLFGYSISLYKNKLLIGSPFASYQSENIIPWPGVSANTQQYNKPSGSIVGFNGGAGVAYLYEVIPNQSGLTPFGNRMRWSLTRKFKPSSINIGQDTNNLNAFLQPEIFGENNYKSEDLSLSIVNDQFGHSVQINSDMIAIGAPGHDYDNYIQNIYERGGEASGAFIRKSFDTSLDIPQRIVNDLGSSGNRSLFPNSGISVLNNGAIFTYENRITGWYDRSQAWVPVQKLIAQGYNARSQIYYVGSAEIPVSGSENDRFGAAIYLDRPKRNDADYTVGVGVSRHKFLNSGQAQLNTGATYSYDGMLRRVPPSTQDKNSFIHATVFGDTINDTNPIVPLRFINSGSNISIYNSGIIYSNNEGEIFVEVSGQDLKEKIYIRHRPYIKAIYGRYVFGEQSQDNLNLMIDGDVNRSSGNINLFSNAPDSEIVYSNLGLYQDGILGYASGVPSGLCLYAHSPDAILVSESGFALYASGTGFTEPTLNLRVRGK
jgi:hypothetical protein